MVFIHVPIGHLQEELINISSKTNRKPFEGTDIIEGDNYDCKERMTTRIAVKLNIQLNIDMVWKYKKDSIDMDSFFNTF